MIDNIPLQTKDERKEIFRIIGEIKSTAEDLAELSRPMFNGLRFLSDSELSRRLSVSKSTLANYRLKGLFGTPLKAKSSTLNTKSKPISTVIIILRSSNPPHQSLRLPFIGLSERLIICFQKQYYISQYV